MQSKAIRTSKGSILKTILDFRKNIEDLKPNDFKTLSNYAKRFISLILSGGITESTLFAYSKAKMSNIDGFLKSGKNALKKDKDLSESEFWTIILVYIYKCVLKERCNLKTPDLIEILSSECFRTPKKKIVEKEIIRHLFLFARIMDAYGDKNE